MNDAGVLESIRRYQLVSEAELLAADLEAKRAKDGRTVLSLLVKNELVSDDQLRRLEQRQGKVRPACFKCLKLATLDRAGFSGDYTCPYCKEAVSFKRGTAGHVEELLPNPPDRAVDKIVEKLLVKHGITAEQLTLLKKQVRTTMPRPSLIDLLARDTQTPRSHLFRLKGKAEALIRKKIPQMSELRSDYELGRLLSMVLLCSHRTLSDLLQHQFEAVIKGRYEPLRDALRAKGELTAYQQRRFIPECFEDRARRQSLLDLIEEERQLPEQAASAEQIEVDWDDSMNELLLESRELRINLLDD